MRINQNIAALNTYRQLSANNVNTGKSLEKLSSGLRINRAGDDAAGLAISEKMRAQVRGLDQASRNSQDAISLIQTAEGALNETQSILQRMRELAVQSANDTNVTADRDQIQKEINQLTSEINRIGNTTEFNTMKLLDSSKVNGAKAVAGVNNVAGAVAHAAADVKFASGKVPTFADGKINVASGAGTFVGNDASGWSGNISIQRSGNAVIVDIKSSGSGRVSGHFVVNANASGVYKFDNLGVSFTINDLGDWASGSNGKITFDKSGAQTLPTSNELATQQKGWTTITQNNGVKNSHVDSGLTALSIADGLAEGNYYITFSGVGGSGNFTIIHSGKDGVKTQVAFQSGVLKDSDFTFSGGGISFTFNADVAFSGNSGVAQLKFEVKQATTTGKDDSLTFQIGANQNQTMSLSIGDMRSAALGISSTGNGTGFTSDSNVTNGTNSTNVERSLDVSNSSNAANAITKINKAIETVSSERAKLGAVQNRLEHTINNLGTSSENLTAAESRIRDVDMAREMMNFTKNNILTQAAQSMLAQANQQPQGVLQLLR